MEFTENKNLQNESRQNEELDKRDNTGPEEYNESDSTSISEWVINAPDKVKIIGCGDYGSKMVNNIYINYPTKLTGIKYQNFNKPTKPDYLDLKLEPDYRNIRAAGIKREVEEQLESRNLRNKETRADDGVKVSLIGRIKRALGQKQESAAAVEHENLDSIPAETSVAPADDLDHPAAPIEGNAGSIPHTAGEQDQRDMLVNKAKSELQDELQEFLSDTDLLFIVTDLGSSYGMDNSLSAAKLARSMDIITVGLVILPTKLEKLEEVDSGNRSLQAFRLIADIVVVVPDIEHIIEGYLVLIISELIELMATSGLINLDVADVKTVVGGGNVAMIGFGAGHKKDGNKIMQAINEAISSPILNVDLDGVNRTLVNVTGDSEMTITEAQRAAEAILERIQPDARLLWGASVHPKLKGAVKVMVMVGVKPKNILVHIYANS